MSRLQADVEGQLAQLEKRHEEERERIRQEVEARTAEVVAQEWSARLDSARAEIDRVRAESESMRRAEIAETTAAAEARLAAETARLLAEAEAAASELTIRLQQEREQAILDATARVRDEVRQEMEQRAGDAAARLREIEEAASRALTRAQNEHQESLTRERQRLAAEFASERERWTSEADAERQRLAAERTAREAAEAQLAAAESRHGQLEESTTGVRAEERQARVALFEQLMTAVRTVSDARSLSDTLNALAGAAALLAPRVALFILNERTGTRELQGWRASGFADPSPSMIKLPADDGGLLATAASSRNTISTSTVSAPEFAALAADRAALAVPLTVGGRTVAVLYADDGASGEAEAPSSWPEAIQILGAHASVCLSHITAVRTTQAMRANMKGEVRGESVTDEDHSARRYARLLVSEIKLYNEAAVRAGREKRDLLTRLRPEIDRARRLYEERIPPSIGARNRYFQEELVHTLADGDAALLGSTERA